MYPAALPAARHSPVCPDRTRRRHGVPHITLAGPVMPARLTPMA